MANKFLDQQGLQIVWDSIKAKFESKEELVGLLAQYVSKVELADVLADYVLSDDFESFKKIVSDAGEALIFNEADGGGVKFTDKNGNASFVGVNQDVNGGIGAQLYDINIAENKGAKLDVTKNGIFYTVGDESAKPASVRDVEANEILTRKDVADLIGVLHFRGVFNSLDDVDNPKHGDVAIVGDKEFVYVNIEGQPKGWHELGDEGLYETKADAAAKFAQLSAAISDEESARVAADAELAASVVKKVDKELAGSNGKALIFNEQDGGGAKFEHNDGSEVFVGVNDGGKDGMMAQIYADVEKDGKWSGSRINVYNNKIYYTNQAAVDAGVVKNDAMHEIATIGDVEAAEPDAMTEAEIRDICK